MKVRNFLPYTMIFLATVLLILTQQVWAAPLIARFASGTNASSQTMFSYQGYLTDSSGAPVTDTLDMEFAIYNVRSAGTALWMESQTAIPVVDGVFSTKLGSVTPIDTAIFANNNLWLGVTVSGGDEMIPREQFTSVPFAVQALASNGSELPVGTVISWWRPDTSTSLPSDEWAIADGSTVTDPESPLYGQALPNLLDRFIMGVTTASIGQTGGSNTLNLAHSHQVDNHRHSDSHSHASGTLRALVSVEDDRVYIKGYGSGFNASLANYTGITHSNTHACDQGADVEGSTATWTGNTGWNAPGTNSKLSSSTDNRPQYVGLVFLVRIK